MTNWLKKYQNPAGSLTNNIYFRDPNQRWLDSVGNTYLNDIYNIIENSTDKQAIINDINDMQRRHYGIYTANNGVNKPVNYDTNTENYQKDIIGNYNFVNTTGIQGAINNQRYKTDATKQITGDKVTNGKWGTDGYYGGQTDDRRLLGRITNGTDDYTPDEVSNINNRLKNSGIEMYLDPTTNYYMLRPLEDTPPRIPPVVPPVVPPETPPPVAPPPGVNPPGSSIFNPAEFRKKTMPNFAWSDWAPLGATLAVNNLATEWNRSLASKVGAPLEEAPYLQSKVTDAYYTDSALNERASNIKNQFGELAAGTSDINAQQRLMQQGSEQVNPLYAEAANAKQNEFRQTTQQAQEVANKNNLFGVETRNKNNKSAVALRNAILNANAKRNEEWAANAKDFTNKMYNSYTDALQTYRLNELARNAAERSLRGQQEIEEIQRDFADRYRDPTKSSQFNSFLNELKNSYTTTDDRFAGMFSSDQEYNDFMSSLYGENGELTPEAKAKLLELWNMQNDFASKYRSAYNTDLNNLYYINQIKMKNIANRVALENAQDPYYVSNQLHFNWQDRPFGAKNGGTLKAAKGAKLLSNLNAFLKAKTQADRIKSKESIAVDTQMYKNLNAELDRLNKEQLLLLKTIFK